MIAQKDADKMGYLELRQYIKKLQSMVTIRHGYRADMHGKIAFSLVSIILAIIWRFIFPAVGKKAAV